MGCAIYNSDDVAKQLYFNTTIKQQVINLLGKEAYLNEDFFVTYEDDLNLKKLDTSILVMPCLMNIISIIWASVQFRFEIRLRIISFWVSALACATSALASTTSASTTSPVF